VSTITKKLQAVIAFALLMVAASLTAISEADDRGAAE
jgi:hypothetical protein